MKKMISSRLLNTIEFQQVLAKSLERTENLVIISAYVTGDSIRWIRPLINGSVKIIGRFTPKDFDSGASNIDALIDAAKHGYEIYCLDNLHAKIYLTDRQLFVGSANFTANGLSLSLHSNLETTTEVERSSENLGYVRLIEQTAIALLLSDLERMKAYLQSVDGQTADVSALLDTWPEEILPKERKLLVSDFPLVAPKIACEEYELNKHLPFAMVELCADVSHKVTLIKNSNAYRWLVNLIKDRADGVRFGEITAALHDALADDPKPYRSNIKALLANLISYIKIYCADEIEIYVPGRRSELVRMRNFNPIV